MSTYHNHLQENIGETRPRHRLFSNLRRLLHVKCCEGSEDLPSLVKGSECVQSMWACGFGQRQARQNALRSIPLDHAPFPFRRIDDGESRRRTHLAGLASVLLAWCGWMVGAEHRDGTYPHSPPAGERDARSIESADEYAFPRWRAKMKRHSVT